MCIATTTDDAYLPGTLVLLSSFLRCNPLFRGDIVLIHDGLSEEGKARLEHFPNLRFHTIASAFKARLAPLSADPHLRRALPRFYSLEAFNLPGYDRILALDSDILCQGSVAELVEMDAALACCPDQSYFWKMSRDLQTYEPHPLTHAEGMGASRITFNAGMMMFSPRRLSPSTYSDLVDEVNSIKWSEIRTGHTDSVVLNRYFRDAWELAPEKFNYLISKGMGWYSRSRCSIDEAVFVHFLGRPKPWEVQRFGSVDALHPEQLKAFERWHSASKGDALY